MKLIRAGARYNDAILECGTSKNATLVKRQRWVWHTISPRINYFSAFQYVGKIIQSKDCKIASSVNLPGLQGYLDYYIDANK